MTHIQAFDATCRAGLLLQIPRHPSSSRAQSGFADQAEVVEDRSARFRRTRDNFLRHARRGLQENATIASLADQRRRFLMLARFDETAVGVRLAARNVAWEGSGSVQPPNSSQGSV
jgi:hypothetical protein